MSDPRKLYAHVSFDLKASEPVEVLLEKHEYAYKYLYHTNKASKILNDAKALQALNYLYMNTMKLKQDEQIKLGLTYDIVKILVSLIETLYQRLIELINSKETTELANKNKTATMSVCLIVIGLVEQCSYHSIQFCDQFHEENGVKTVFHFINNRKIQETFRQYRNEPKSAEFVILKGVMKTMVFTLINLAKVNFSYKACWRETNSLKNLLFYMTNSKAIFDYKMSIVLVIAFSVNDEDLKSTNELDEILSFLIQPLAHISHELTASKQIKRSKIKLNERNQETEVCFYTKTGKEWNVIDFLKALFNLGLNNSTKRDIYFKHDVFSCLKRIVLHGNEVEKEFALSLVHQFCFDSAICEHIRNKNQAFIGQLKELSENNETNKRIRSNTNGILYLLGIHQVKSLKPSQSSGNQIVLSYESTSRNLTQSIETELGKLGFDMFVHSENETDLNGLMQTLQNSFCLIVCVNERYKHSNSCRLVCEYAVKINKPIVCLITQKDYKPDGWLNSLAFKRSFVFSKHEFHKCLNGLVEEIEQIKMNQTLVEPMPITHSAINKPRQEAAVTGIFDKIKVEEMSKLKSEVLSWSEQRVSEWMEARKLSKRISTRIFPCDGHLLHEMFLIRCEAPEYFHESLKNTPGYKEFTLREFILLSKELRGLFYSN